jgi:hypothetical protein
MSHIFDGSRWISIPIGIIWALLVTNLYLLFLYTISPTLLPVAIKKKTSIKGRIKKVLTVINPLGKSSYRSFSFLFRTGLILFLAVLIAQPFNVLLFSPSYEDSDRFAATIKEILGKIPLAWFLTFINCIIFLLPVYLKFQVRTFSQKSFKDDFEAETTLTGLKELREQLAKPADFEKLSRRILETDINSIRTSDFYFQKALIEYRIILEEYERFKQVYSTVLTESNKRYARHCWISLTPILNKLENINPAKHNAFYNQILEDLEEETIQRYEYWADPPFRTTYRSSDVSVESESELLENFYQQKM